MKMLENIHEYTRDDRRFLLYKYLISHAGKDTVVTPEQIQDFYQYHQMRVSISTVYSDLEALKNPLTYDLDIEYNFSKRGYCVKNPLFEPYEIRLIAHSIQSSKFLTQTKADSIIKKLKKLTDKETASTINSDAFVFERTRSYNDSVISDSDKLYQAISLDQQIMFRYFNYTPRKDTPKKYGKNGAKITVSPYKLIWSNGYLLLLAYISDKHGFSFFRVDRIEDVSRPIKIEREGKEKYKQYFSLLKNVKSPDLSDILKGKLYTVKIFFDSSVASEVIDRFGNDVVMIPDGAGFTVTQNAFVGKAFLSWISSFEGKARIESPDEVKREMYLHELKAQFSYRKRGEEYRPVPAPHVILQEDSSKKDGET